MPMRTQRPDGPIPGENFLSNTQSRPWHHPPEEADFVRIVDKAITSLNTPQRLAHILTLMETGDSILDVVVGMLRVSVSQGKVGIDQAILAAGPIARFMEAAAEEAGITYDRGWDQEPTVMTPIAAAAMAGTPIPEAPVEVAPKPVSEPAAPSGLMAPTPGPAPASVQAGMMGQAPEGMPQ